MEIFTDPYMLEKLDRDLNEIIADTKQRWCGMCYYVIYWRSISDRKCHNLKSPKCSYRDFLTRWIWLLMICIVGSRPK
jgi:hypothetical protein